MDPTDPLADTSAPRYAIESDEEEDEPNPLRPSSSSVPVKTPEIKIIGAPSPGNPLIVASGRAGAYWARGADLGEQTGGVYVDNIQVGLLFTPTHFSPSTVLISEATTTLPLAYQTPYAQHVLGTLSPSRVALLDTYSAPAYASESAEVSLHDAPMRWVSSAEGDSEERLLESKLQAHPFAPPNLLQSTSAAFILSSYISSLSSSLSHSSPPPPPSTTTATALLLPTLHYPSPPPKTLLPAHTPIGSSEDHEDAWSAGVMQGVSEVLAKLAGVKGKGERGTWKWEVKGREGVPPPAKRRSEIGEGGMYL